MTAAERLTLFFYLLTRGTPSMRGLGWGDVNGVIDEVLKTADQGCKPEYTSAAGCALAKGLTERLLGAEPVLEVGDSSATHYRCECCEATFKHDFDIGARFGDEPTPSYFSATRCNETARGVVLCAPCCVFVDALDGGAR